MNIPLDVTQEILARLPAECVLRVRGVCRAWRRMIDDPSFIKAHTQNRVCSDTHTLLLRNKTGAPLFSFSLDSFNFINGNGSQIIDATLCKKLIHVPPSTDLQEVASCNGSILLSDHKIWLICNPLTRERVEVPLPDASWVVGESETYGYGFGYDMDVDDYKVVRIDQNEDMENQTLIYSLKLNSWRMINDICPCSVPCWAPGAYLDGKLYWLSTDEHEMVALHLGTETYSHIPLPPSDALGKQSNLLSFEYCLDALDGCLILSDTNFLSGWVMRDEGSWIQLFSFDRRRLAPDIMGKEMRIVAYLRSKRQVFLQHDLGFICYHLDNHSFNNFSIHGEDIQSCKICPGSLVRLNIGGGNAGKTSTRKRKRIREYTNKR